MFHFQRRTLVSSFARAHIRSRSITHRKLQWFTVLSYTERPILHVPAWWGLATHHVAFSSMPSPSTSKSTPTPTVSKKKRGKNTSDTPLRNDSLLAALRHQSPKPSEVRIVVDADEALNIAARSEVMSLGNAVALAKDLQRDLVEIDLSQTIPVLRITDFQKQRYWEAKKKKQIKASSRSQTVKQVKIKVGIADNDFQRKMKNMMLYLEQGHQCKVVVHAGYFSLRDNVDALGDALKRVQQYWVESNMNNGGTTPPKQGMETVVNNRNAHILFSPSMLTKAPTKKTK